MSRSRKVALGSVVALGVVLCAFVIAVGIGEGLPRAGLWAGVLGVPVGVAGAIVAVWPVLAARPKMPLPAELAVPAWVVDRPDEVSTVVAVLLGGGHGTKAVTAGLLGAGGFGKTTLARVVCADRRVRRRFRGYVHLVTVGRDVRGAAAIAAKVNDVIRLLTGEDATFTDPELAGQQLGALLDAGPRRLLVLDDLWEPEQLAPFADGQQRCALLLTTRNPGLLAGRAVPVQVGQMSAKQSRALLTAGLPPLDPVLVGGLLAVTGRWPLLLRLVNRILANAEHAKADVAALGGQLLARLRADGPAAVDEIGGPAGGGLEVGKPADRALAVRATIGASTSLLDSQEAARFAELGVFAEDETISFSLVARLWRASTGLDELQASQLCARLGELGLVSLTGSSETGGVALHDVIRDFVRGELGPPELARLSGVLLDAIAAGLPPARPLAPADPGAVRTAWWELDRDDRYLWYHLIEHLRDAGRRSEGEEVACDLRWVGARLQESGPAAPAADLARAGTPQAVRLREVMARTAHLLAPTDPVGAVIDVLHSRVAADWYWGPQVTALRDLCPRPRLVNRWPLPDLPDPALRRALAGHEGWVEAVAISPDGCWLATASRDGTARIWDAATGQKRAVLTGHRGWVQAVAIAPDGSWLATAGDDRTARIWDAATGKERAVLTGHQGGVEAVAIAPDGSWLATGSFDGTARIWDAATGKERAVLTGHQGMVGAVAVSPDGTWLATEDSRTVRIWDAATGHERKALTGHDVPVWDMAIAPDGTWLATASFDGTARIWDVATGQEGPAITGHKDQVRAVAIAPDGSWLATGSFDGTARIWDAATRQERAVLTGHSGPVEALAIAPDGSWLATGSDQTARIWDAVTGQERAAVAGHDSGTGAAPVAPDGNGLLTDSEDDEAAWIWDATTGQKRPAISGHKYGVQAIAVARDSSWLATGSEDDGIVRIWETATGRKRATLTGHSGPVFAVAIAPDSSWLATGSEDGTVRIWDAASGQERVTLTGHQDRVNAVAIAPDGSWLATGSRDWTARIWDAATGQERATLAGHRDPVLAVAIAPDGSWLATGSIDGTVRIWDAANGQKRATLAGHSGWVLAVAIAPDGSWLATGSDDWTARIWDAATGKERAALTSHQDTVNTLAIAPDGSWLASGSDDRTVRIWDAATWRVQALMRVEEDIDACAWLDTQGLAAGGPDGLYLFDFLIGNAALPSA